LEWRVSCRAAHLRAAHGSVVAPSGAVTGDEARVGDHVVDDHVILSVVLVQAGAFRCVHDVELPGHVAGALIVVVPPTTVPVTRRVEANVVGKQCARINACRGKNAGARTLCVLLQGRQHIVCRDVAYNTLHAHAPRW